MQFEWDRNKSLSNLETHGISFDDAIALWRSPNIESETAAHNDDVRMLVTGIIGGKHWTAVITPRGEKTRIISVRRAREHEREAYDERFKEGSDGRGNRPGV